VLIHEEGLPTQSLSLAACKAIRDKRSPFVSRGDRTGAIRRACPMRQPASTSRQGARRRKDRADRAADRALHRALSTAGAWPPTRSPIAAARYCFPEQRDLVVACRRPQPVQLNPSKHAISRRRPASNSSISRGATAIPRHKIMGSSCFYPMPTSRAAQPDERSVAGWSAAQSANIGRRNRTWVARDCGPLDPAHPTLNGLRQPASWHKLPNTHVHR
jgi:hypothetical protein